MYHFELIRLGQALGYKNLDDRGLCQGFSMMWIQAVCVDESQVNDFNKRMELLEPYASKPQKLAKEIKNLRTTSQQELNLHQKMMLEVPAFFEGISLYLNPLKHEEVWGNKKLKQCDQIDIAYYAQSQKLEDLGGLSKAFGNTDLYNQEELVLFLNKLSDTLQNRQDVGIDLGANNHSVAIRVFGKDSFQLVDTNHLDKVHRIYTSEELARQLNNSFSNQTSWFHWFFKPKPLLMSSSVFTAQDKPIQNVEALHSHKKITQLDNRKNYNLLDVAIYRDDVALLKRMNFNVIDVNQIKENGSTALKDACILNSEKAVDFLLSIPSIDVNCGLTSPFKSCLYDKQYHLAKKILNHPSFDPNKGLTGGNVLHELAFSDSAPEIIELAKDAIKKGIDINARDASGFSPIQYACMNGNQELVETFIEQGVPLKDDYLSIAVLGGNNDLILMLLDRNLDPYYLNFDQENALHYGSISGDTKCIETLLSRDVDCNIRNKDGLTPLMIACEKGHTQLIPMLLPKTTLSMNDIRPNSSLVKQIARCDETIKIEFLKKALTCYKDDRILEGKYLDMLHLGYTKEEKIQAAQALLDWLDGKEVDLQQHHNVLNNGRLSHFYHLSLSCFPDQKPGSSNDLDQVESTKKMCTFLGVTALPALEPVPPTHLSALEAKNPTLLPEYTEDVGESYNSSRFKF